MYKTFSPIIYKIGMKLVLIFLIIPVFFLSQNLDEYRLVDWDRYESTPYVEMPKSKSTLAKDIKRYSTMTYNETVMSLVNSDFDSLRVRRGLMATSYRSDSKWGDRVISDFVWGFSDSLNQPIILRKINQKRGCDSCVNSIVDFVVSDSTMMSILFSKKLTRSYICYFQMSKNKEWQTSFIVVYFKNRAKRTQFFWYELPDDVK
jgi:hypothetical protein